MAPPIDTVVRYFDAELVERRAVVIANSPAQCPALDGQPEGTVSLAVFFPSEHAPSVVMCPDVVGQSDVPAPGRGTSLA